MSILNKLLRKMDRLSEKERQKALNKIMEKDVILLSKSFDWWNNKVDYIYNKQ